ncbi:MAG TPA: C-terminal helicase domain-containing protein, partial [Vicingus sp.]|nr:C-terminal helicase domain-containing protein [Vicingus sp.]
GQKIALIKSILTKTNFEHVLIFTGKKIMVKEITQALSKVGIQAKGIQSDLDQKEREQVLLDFANKKIRVLVATDILARGIDIKGINLVINYEVPRDEEDYVHRIGRTARGDNKGVALTFINENECYEFSKIEKLIEKEVPKIKLPEGFDEGPAYNPIRKTSIHKKKFHPKKKSHKPN